MKLFLHISLPRKFKLNQIIILNRFKYTKMTSQTKTRPNRVALVWFRNDLRLNDNLTLNKAIDLLNKKRVDAILPFYCYDKEMLDGLSRIAKIPRCGPFRRNFLIESVDSLKENLINKLDSNLYISYGEPVTELTKLIESVLSTSNIVDCVLASKEVPSEEVELEEKIAKYLKEKNIIFYLVWDSTMIHIDDLPYDNLSKMPDTFTHFRKDVEQRGDYKVRSYVSIKENYKLPTFKELNNFGHENTPKKIDIPIIDMNKSAIANMKGYYLPKKAKALKIK
jgi:deoxyribodipyrimidine photolyase